MKHVYTVAIILNAIVRTVIGLALMLPIVAVCALLDRLAAVLLIKAGYDYETVESMHEDCCDGLVDYYYDLSSFK